ncbi:UNVERIFIED_CONTAM: hypothetical protein PYX00_006699 [Menopon gallinae]|uniref:Transcription factor CBF/NF-Y/archaeal histone domain-containing protein n=1 Tax=Menopon gallinae TaxID=328185 RepID=A0AAW2HX76_9NEOP
MPSKKKKYNARFPAGRIKKIMQTDEEVGKVAQAVPVIISRTLELFVESLLKSAMQITSAKNAKTLTPSHMKQCILSESRFDFLKDLVKGIPDVSNMDDEPGTPVGNLSPGMTPPAKSPSSFSCFQFRRKSDGGSSRSSATTSQVSSVPQAALPKFYKEIAIGGDDLQSKEEEERVQPVSCRAPVIQHTGPRLNHRPAGSEEHEKSQPSVIATSCGSNQGNENKLTNCINRNSSSDEEEEDDDEPQENGYHKLEIVTKTCAIDEDYDT